MHEIYISSLQTTLEKHFSHQQSLEGHVIHTHTLR